ncbi:MAG TPA: thermonuclease family protein [Pirellulales bacterium]|jgi:micrococcal nuclease|nr:thermonuclease family protein [Pirellulales bacterium]
MSKRRLRPARPARLVVWLVAGVLVSIRACQSLEPPPAPPADVSAEHDYGVARVVDGDTFLLDNHTRVRLIGVDAPETVKPHHPIEPWGPEASRFSHQFLDGKRVRLEFDHERRDRYGRLLAYVWVGNRMLNEELLRAGLARYEPQYHYSRDKKLRFQQLESAARAAGRGIWSTHSDRSP